MRFTTPGLVAIVSLPLLLSQGCQGCANKDVPVSVSAVVSRKHEIGVVYDDELVQGRAVVTQLVAAHVLNAVVHAENIDAIDRAVVSAQRFLDAEIASRQGNLRAVLEAGDADEEDRAFAEREAGKLEAGLREFMDQVVNAARELYAVRHNVVEFARGSAEVPETIEAVTARREAAVAFAAAQNALIDGTALVDVLGQGITQLRASVTEQVTRITRRLTALQEAQRAREEALARQRAQLAAAGWDDDRPDAEVAALAGAITDSHAHVDGLMAVRASDIIRGAAAPAEAMTALADVARGIDGWMEQRLAGVALRDGEAAAAKRALRQRFGAVFQPARELVALKARIAAFAATIPAMNTVADTGTCPASVAALRTSLSQIAVPGGLAVVVGELGEEIAGAEAVCGVRRIDLEAAAAGAAAAAAVVGDVGREAEVAPHTH